MPKTANDALSGMLAEGVQAEEVLSTLEESGYSISPPEGDSSYPEEGGEMPEAPEGIMAIGLGEPPETEEEEEGEPDDKRLDAAKKAMKKHGFE